ncbi:MAG TPA: tetratricopeptide repeat protein [candidate division WWE3 bacterium]|uniref:Tetratricopeptide repeat protein n=1 Tax=candidate division WWE3 bacterium TaxID=2053526 RepID=A0A7V5IZV1_UNCKA|nr:tetratricopeptide repeat protein [candidate division WWE3 bacterium]
MDYSDLEKEAVQLALKGEWEKAIEINKKILSLGHETAGVYNRLGKSYSELGMWHEAINSFSKALELDPLNSVAKRGLTNAKMNKKAGINTKTFNQDSLVHDASTSRILSIPLKNKSLNLEHTFKLVKGGDDFYLLVDTTDNRQIKRVSRKYLNLKQDLDPKELDVSVIEYDEKNLKVKVSSSVAVFRAEKQEIEPELKLKKKEIEEEKKEIQKMFEEIEEEN